MRDYRNTPLRKFQRRAFGLTGLIWLLLPWGLPKSALAQSRQPQTHEKDEITGILDALEPSSSSSNHASGQLSGYISGTVLDKAGDVAVDAQLQLAPRDKFSMQQQLSGENGQFFYADVPPGPFQLTIKAQGFETQQFFGILRPGETYLVPGIRLAIANVRTEVQVQTRLAPVEVAEDQIKQQEKQRVLWVIPNFYVSYEPNAVPLNVRQKFGLAWKTTADPFTFVGVVAVAAVEQATNAFPGYGQGWDGYAKRLGSSYANVVTGTFIGSAVLPSLLKQDPRYFYKGTGSTRWRLLYALASPLICKGDNMRWQPNYSNIVGAFASGGISYLYYPNSNRDGAVLVFQNSAIRLGEMAFEGILQEFLIRRLTPHLRRRRQ